MSSKHASSRPPERSLRNSILGLILPYYAEGGQSSTREALRRLIVLRVFVTLGSVSGLLLAQLMVSVEIDAGLLGILVGLIGVSVAAGFWRLEQSWVVSVPELLGHLLGDVVFLSALLLFTGGVGNPLISYLLVLLAVAATILPRPYIGVFVVICVLIYTAFLGASLGQERDHSGEMMDFQLHLVGMWVIFMVSAALITVFVTRMAGAIEARENNLAKARESELRNEQLIAIGTLAAGTAHALGTPLSTMSVLLTELDKLSAQELSSNAVKDDIRLLREQVYRCKDSLAELIRYYQKEHSSEQESATLDSYISDIRDYITNIHPSARISFTNEMKTERRISSDLSIKHAVINLIENGIKAATHEVQVKFKEAEDSGIEISIQDDGPGVPASIMENMGEPFISSRKDSMGLGIFLANASIERVAGSIEMFNLKSGGALAVIQLPGVEA